jgi:outer membrane protein assembly factor BamB
MRNVLKLDETLDCNGKRPVRGSRDLAKVPRQFLWGVSNVAGLEKKWEFTTGGDVSATPAVDGDTVYFPDRAGNLYAVDSVYVGTSSVEESFAAVIPGYDCCSFRARMAALDLNTGAIVWELRTTPPGFPGNAVRGSSPRSTPSGDSSTSPPGTTTTRRRRPLTA